MTGEQEKNTQRTIRPAEERDLDAILACYDYARKLMKENGNPNQWGDSYPPRAMIEDDIRLGRSSVVVEQDEVCGVFVFIVGDDPTYAVIEDGAWVNDEPYGVVHRAAGSAAHRGILNSIMEYCESSVSNLRVDTHSDNHAMHHLLNKLGFQRCGIIYVEDGTPRVAYQKVIS